MKFAIARDTLLKPLNLASGVVERRQTLPILANLLLKLEGNQLSITGTDLEVEMVGRVILEQGGVTGEVTVPAKKLADICKSLPDRSEIEFFQEEDRLVLRSGRSRFALSTLPAAEYPSLEQQTEGITFVVPQGQLKQLIDQTSFAMAQQDVRYYLNGMLFELKSNKLRLVATDGHRLAMTTYSDELPLSEQRQVIVPRKGVIELARLLQANEEPVTITISANHIRAVTTDFTFTSKLVDGKFPDYERVLPKVSTKIVFGSRDDLRQAFQRTAILSNEKYRGVRLILSDNSLQILANNPDQEEAEETVAVDYQGEGLEIGFNVSYLLDVLSVLDGPAVRIAMSDSNSSALVQAGEDANAAYVVMPMRL
jgi:DNA polymerase-3 subunit beta